MNKNEIELKSLNSFGICKAIVEDTYVSIRVSGVSGCLKAWLTGKESIEIGNLVNGNLKKQIDTTPFNGILLTQSGRQMFYGKFKTSPPASDLPSIEESPIFSFNDGYSWKKITDKKYPSDNLSIRYILSHQCFYNSFLAHGKYFYGTKNNLSAIAIECDIKNEPHPFLHLAPYSTYHNGYMIVVTDGKNFLNYE